MLPSGSYGEDGLPDVKVPEEVVRKAVEFLRERVKGNIEIVRDGEEEEDEEEEEEENVDDDDEGETGGEQDEEG